MPTPHLILPHCSIWRWHVRQRHLYRLSQWTPGVPFAQFSCCFGDASVADGADGSIVLTIDSAALRRPCGNADSASHLAPLLHMLLACAGYTTCIHFIDGRQECSLCSLPFAFAMLWLIIERIPATVLAIDSVGHIS